VIMTHNLVAIALASSLSGLVSAADLQQPRESGPIPTDIELRTAYCIRVVQSDIDALQHILASPTAKSELDPEFAAELRKARAVAEKGLDERTSTLHRLQSFLLPRAQYLDATALMAAMGRADVDVRAWSQLTTQCARVTCKDEIGAGGGSACISSCLGGDLGSRLNSCRNPAWLPF
jgi:hypothetical protein